MQLMYTQVQFNRIFKLTKTSVYMFVLIYLLYPVVYFSLSNSIKSLQNGNTTAFNIYCFSSHCVIFLLSMYCLLPCYESFYILYDILVRIFSKYHIWLFICDDVLHIKYISNLNWKLNRIVFYFTKLSIKIMYKIFRTFLMTDLKYTIRLRQLWVW